MRRLTLSTWALAALLLPQVWVSPVRLHAQAGGPETRTHPATGAYPIDVEAAARPVARAIRAPSDVIIDGRLDETAWLAAEPITEFIQSQPRTGWPASQPTVVRILYDDEHLYIGAFLYDPQPYTVMSLQQDFESHDTDLFGVAIDTYLDRRNSYMFLVNPLGAVMDGQTFNDSRDVNLIWEGPIEVETALADSGWSLELAVPWTTLRFAEAPGGHEWGLQMVRRLRRTNEDIYWAPVDRRDRVHKMSRAGTLTGISGIRQGRNLAIKPYAKAGRSESGPAATAAATATVDNQLELGGDLKWGLTPMLTLDATLNTDFSQVEVDQEQVNLTRFSLFFPERRDFFIENSGVFTFGDVTERNYRMGSSLRDFTLFHSRRIGLQSGQPVPIIAGGRLTGRAGGFQIGLLNMQTERLRADDTSIAMPAENFLVARVRRNVFGNSDLGAMLINRQTTGGDDDWNRSYGVDANLTFLTNLIINSYIAASDAPAAGSDDRTARLSVAWRDRLWDVSAFAKTVGEDFDPGVGFVRRTGIREWYGTLGAHPRLSVPLVYGINPYVELDYVTNDASVLESREGIAALAVEFLDGGSFELRGADRFERLSAPFEIAEDVTLQPGGYGFRDATVSYRSSGGRPFTGNISVTAGEFYDGTKTTVGVGALWRVSPRLAIDLGVDRNAVELPAGAFDADVAAGRVNLALSRALFASGFVQYNTSADQLVTNLRLNWIHAPLSDLFVVFVERRDLDSEVILERTLALKATKLFGF
ncbi:MAG: DUF5916 domain-containing protein [Longimicrobiales bacterium]